MRKIFNILIILLFLTVIGLAFYAYQIQKRTAIKNSVPSSQQQITSNQSSPPDENKEKMTIRTAIGDIIINNLYKQPVAKLFHNGVLFQQKADFEMSYYPDDNGFIISLLNLDLQKSRDEAEKVFLEALGIDQNQACQLKVSVGTTNDINEKAAGQNFGLSFCPNGKALPSK